MCVVSNVVRQSTLVPPILGSLNVHKRWDENSWLVLAGRDDMRYTSVRRTAQACGLWKFSLFAIKS